MRNNYLLENIDKIRSAIEDLINQKLIKGVVAKDPVIYFLENVLYTGKRDFHRVYYHALISRGTPKIFDVLSNYHVLDINRYIYPVTFTKINYIMEGGQNYSGTLLPYYTLDILAAQIYTRASVFDFAHHFILYIINMIIVNRYRIEINEVITKAEDIIITIASRSIQSIYKVVLASYYETTLFEAVV